MTNISGISEHGERVLVSVGVALLVVQATERLIGLCVTHILQLDGPLTLEFLHRQEHRKRTLGQMLAKMREHVGIDDAFHDLLSEFLDKRNIFVHRLADVPNWSLQDEKGIAVANNFLKRLLRLNDIVMNVFGALAQSYQKQNPTFPTFPTMPGVEIFEAAVNAIFFEKEKPPR